MRRTNCPTCGGSAYYPSKNFQDAEIMVSAINRDIEKYLGDIKEVAEVIASRAGHNKELKDLSSQDLFSLLVMKLQEEYHKEREANINIGRMFLGRTLYGVHSE